jgi:RNA polymerase sigma-70 factor, ECF subfamily
VTTDISARTGAFVKGFHHGLLGEGHPLSDDDEASFAGRLACGEAEAFEQFVGLYQPRVARLAQRLLGWNGDVDDVVQDVFFVAWQKAGSFRRDASLWTWLTVITLNQCRSRIRRKNLLQRLPFRLIRRDDHPPADRGSIRQETDRRVRNAVTALKPAERELVVLHYLEHRPAAELATLLGVSRNTVEVRLHRVRQKLKATLADLVTG